MEPILKIESLKKYYGRSKNQTKALNGITFQVMPGEFLGIMGSSGSGKSTLLNCIAAVIQRPESFSISAFAFLESRAPVGSSARIIPGFRINARAAATRCFCPPAAPANPRC